MMRCRRVAGWTIFAASVLAWIVCAILPVGSSVHANQTAQPPARILKLGTARADTLYGLTLAVKNPVQLQGDDAVRVTVNDAQGEVESKRLHSADLDLYLTIRPRKSGPVTVSLSSTSAAHIPEIGSSFNRILQSSATLPVGAIDLKRGVIAASPNGTW